MKIYRKLNDKEWMSYDPNVGGSIWNSLLFLLYGVWYGIKYIMLPAVIISMLYNCCGCAG